MPPRRTRVAGLSMAQGKFIYVRGLDERYTSALLNCSPSPAPSRSSAWCHWTCFPQRAADRAVQKTYSARYPVNSAAA